MIRYAAQPLGQPNKLTIADGVAANPSGAFGDSQITPGAAIAKGVLVPDINQSPRWTLYGITASCVITCAQAFEGLAANTYGLYGKLIAGLSKDVSPSGAQVPYAQLPIPADTGMLMTLFDGSVDPSPPVQLSGRPLFQTMMFPQPLGSADWALYSVAAWFTPSILGNADASVGNGISSIAAYGLVLTLIYDDGLDESGYPTQ